MDTCCTDSSQQPFAKTICSICYEDLKPTVEDLQAISICGHVFHELCIQQWFEYCKGKKKCPICKQTCLAANVSRLYFQSVGDSNDSNFSQKLQTRNLNSEELQVECNRLEGKVKGLSSTLESRDNDLKNIINELCICKEKLMIESALKEDALEQKHTISRLLTVKTQVRLKESGISEFDVAKQTDADYQKLKKRPFPHKKAWDVVKDYDKWQQVVLLGEGGSKRKVNQEYQTGSNDDGGQEDDRYEMPDLNEDNTPTQSRRSKKSKSESTSVGELEKNFAEYTLKKLALIERRMEQASRKEEKDELQIIDLKKKTKARDWKIFTEPHEHANSNPRLLRMLLAQKTELAEAYRWEKYWEEE